MTYDTKHYQKLVADLQAENDALKIRIQELESNIIEADSFFNVDGKSGTIESAELALVSMSSMGAQALSEAASRDALIAELLRKIDDLCKQLGEADAKTTAPKCPVCKQTMFEDEFGNGGRYWACISIACPTNSTPPEERPNIAP